MEKFKGYKEKLRPYIVDAVEYMKAVQDNKRTMLVESSQALSTIECSFSGGFSADIVDQCLIWIMAAIHSSHRHTAL